VVLLNGAALLEKIAVNITFILKHKDLPKWSFFRRNNHYYFFIRRHRSCI